MQVFPVTEIRVEMLGDVLSFRVVLHFEGNAVMESEPLNEEAAYNLARKLSERLKLPVTYPLSNFGRRA